MANDMAKKSLDNSIPWDEIDGNCSDFEIAYPKLGFFNGSPKSSNGINKTGGFFLETKEIPNFTGEGFTKQVRVTDDGKEIEGFGAKETKLAIIRIKGVTWHLDDSNKNVPHLQALCFVKGCDDLLLLSLRTPSKAIVFAQQWQYHLKQNVSVANRTRPAGVSKSIEPYALWFHVGASDLVEVASKDGKSKSRVTPPQIISPKEIDRNYVVGLYVGTANYTNFRQVWTDTKSWQSLPMFRRSETVTNDSDDFDGVINEAQHKQILDLSMAKNVDEKEFCLTLTNGETDRFEALRKSEFKEAMDRLKVM